MGFPLVDGFERRQIQAPELPTKLKPKRICQQHHRARRPSANWRCRHLRSKQVTQPLAQRLRRDAVVTTRQLAQRPPLQDDRLQHSNRQALTWTTAPAMSYPPRPLATRTLTSAIAKTTDCAAATRRFRMQRIITREFSQPLSREPTTAQRLTRHVPGWNSTKFP